MNDPTTPIANMFAEVDNPPEVKPEVLPQPTIAQLNPLPADQSAAGASPLFTDEGGVTPKPGPDDIPSFITPKADLIVGATGSGKTINIGRVADYVLSKYGKLTRMCSTDPSGAGPLVGEVKAGKIEFWAVHAWKNKIEAMYKSTKGYWPLRVDDPESPLVPPDAGTWEVYGFGAYEGLTSYGDTILDDLRESKASLSQDPSYSWKQGEFETSGGNQSYYGMMQDTLKLWVVNTHLLKYEQVLWTALESKGKDKDGNVVYGPLIGGKQAIGRAGQWFVNFVHMDIIPGASRQDAVTKQTIVDIQHVLFLKTHIDPLNLVPFPSKVRAPIKYAKEVPDYIPDGNMATMYRLLDGMYERQMVEGISELEGIKGLKERLLEKAAKAKIAEAERAEKRAKAAGMLKPMVSVAAPRVTSVLPSPVSPVSPVSPATVPMAPVSPGPVTTPRPAGLPTIQNVRAPKK